MARIPDRGPLQAPRARTITPSGVETGNLGLQHLGEALDHVAASKQQTAAVEARVAIGSLDNQFASQFEPAAGAYDGRQPGFARDQIAGFDRASAETRAGLSPDAQVSYDQLNQAARVRAFDQAAGVEGERSGARIRQEQELVRSTRVVSTLADTRAGYAASFATRLQAFDGSHPGLVTDTLADLDQRATAAVEAAPADDRPALQLAFANFRADEQMRLQGVERGLTQNYLATRAGTSIDVLTSSVMTDAGQYAGALRQVPTLAAVLPAAQRDEFVRNSGRAIATARFTGMINRQQFDQVDTELNSGRYDAVLGPEAKAGFLARTSAERNSVHAQLALGTLNDRVQAEVASIETTGQSTGLTEADFASLGPNAPVAVQQWQRQVRVAQLTYQGTRGMISRTPADQAAQVELMRPPPGDQDFAVRQAAFERAQTMVSGLQEQRTTDPAGAAAQAPENAALWRSFAGADPAMAPVVGAAYVADTLRRQTAMGIPASSQRILPTAEARRVVHSISAQPNDAAGQTAAMQSAYAYASRFGAHGGRVLQELQRAGFNPVAAAVVNATDGDQFAIRAYARGQEAARSDRMDRTHQDILTRRVDTQLAPYLSSFRGSTGGPAYSASLRGAVLTAARGFMADGHDRDDAVRLAAAPYLGRYAFAPGGWRMPSDIASRPGAVRGRHVSGLYAAREGAGRVVFDLLANAGAHLAPRGLQDPRYTDDQRRQRYAAVVRNSAHWVTLADDSGLMLVVPDPRGGVTPVFDNNNQPVSRTWSQLTTARSR